jgi:hypothetical protein
VHVVAYVVVMCGMTRLNSQERSSCRRRSMGHALSSKLHVVPSLTRLACEILVQSTQCRGYDRIVGRR